MGQGERISRRWREGGGAFFKTKLKLIKTKSADLMH